MGVKVTITKDAFGNLLSGENLQRAQYVLANNAMADMDQFVPYLRGHLADSAHLDGKNTIVYTTPYARAQFYGVVNGSPVKNYTRSGHPQATKRWDLKAKSLYGREWAEKVKQSLLEGK